MPGDGNQSAVDQASDFIFKRRFGQDIRRRILSEVSAIKVPVLQDLA